MAEKPARTVPKFFTSPAEKVGEVEIDGVAHPIIAKDDMGLESATLFAESLIRLHGIEPHEISKASASSLGIIRAFCPSLVEVKIEEMPWQKLVELRTYVMEVGLPKANPPKSTAKKEN